MYAEPASGVARFHNTVPSGRPRYSFDAWLRLTVAPAVTTVVSVGAALGVALAVAWRPKVVAADRERRDRAA